MGNWRRSEREREEEREEEGKQSLEREREKQKKRRSHPFFLSPPLTKKKKKKKLHRHHHHLQVRAVAELLPQIDVVQDDPFNSHPSDLSRMGPWALDRVKAGEKTPLPATKVKTPLVELPLGATEDRICGTIDIEKALGQGIKAYEPGLLARANRGILYVDEVNLLDDGLVDVVLDAAAGGVNTVEREGISIRHPAKFIMIGSGNAAEGELRPQLLDRFGLSVDVRTMSEVKMRSAMVRDRMTYEADPLAFCASVEAEQQELRDKLDAATEALKKVEVPREVRLKISEMCSLLGVDGIRGDITTNRAARALAALEGRAEVSLEDVKRVAGLCLNHRLRKDVLDVIDGGAKVALAWRRVTDPARAEREAKAAAEKEAAAAAEAEKSKKAGSWGGLPSAVPGGGGAAAGAAAKKPGSWGGIPGR